MKIIFALTIFVIVGCDAAQLSTMPLIGFELESDRLDMLEENEFLDNLKTVGIKVEPYNEDKEGYDFVLVVELNEYLEKYKFIGITYTLYYRDTLNSVTLTIDIDGKVTNEKVDLSLKLLNQQLLYLIDKFPKDIQN